VRSSVQLTIVLILANFLLLLGAGDAMAQTPQNDDDTPFSPEQDPFGPPPPEQDPFDQFEPPPEQDQFDPLEPPPGFYDDAPPGFYDDAPPGFYDDAPPGFYDDAPPGFFADTPPEYAFLVDPTLPVPAEFEFLLDESLPVPPEYEFLFDPTLPVPEEFAWLFPAVPEQSFTQQAVEQPAPQQAAAQPEPAPQEIPAAVVPTATPVPKTASDLTPLAAIAAAPAEVDAAEPEATEPAEPPIAETATSVPEPATTTEPTTSAAASADVGQVTVTSSNTSSNLIVPLLVFVTIATTTLLATIPVFLRRRSSTTTALRKLSLTDDLTKLANRRSLDSDLRSHHRANDPIAVAMIDIDHFKRLNDEYSHAIGDLVLQRVAAAISQNVRTNDVAYRYGGEEFCVLLPGAAEHEAAAVVERVRRAIESISFELLDRAVTISAGVAVTSGDATEGEQVTVQRADAALYAAKNAGRNRVMRESLLSDVPATP